MRKTPQEEYAEAFLSGNLLDVDGFDIKPDKTDPILECMGFIKVEYPPIDPLYAIGDIHGNLKELRDLLDRIRTHAAANKIETPEVVLIGDMIDRGPDSRGVVELVMGGVPGLRLQPILGNHEQWLVAGSIIRHTAEEWMHNGGADTVESYGVAIKGRGYLDRFYYEALPAGHLLWMGKLPHSIRRGRNLFVHAGIDPKTPLAEQSLQIMLWTRGPFLSWTAPFPEDVKVFHGHTPVPVIEIYENRVNLDTGAGSGGALSAVAILGDEIIASDFWGV